MPASDRTREVRFALLLLVPAALAFAAAEALVRARNTRIEAAAVDWSAMASAAATRTQGGLMRFRPGTTYGRIRFNSLGLRGPEPAIPRPPRTIRLAFLGDSKIFAADQPEAATLPAQTIARLARIHPGCRFDYVNVSGPGYPLTALARLWQQTAPRTQPSLAILLAGSATDLVIPPNRAAPPTYSGLLAHSALLRLARRELTMLSPVAPQSPAATEPLAGLKARQRASLSAMAQALGPTPTIAITYRSRRTPSTTLAAPLLDARHLRQQIPGLTLAKAQAISTLITSEMQATATTAGWHTIDPIASLQSNPRNFIDRSHFSTLGHTRLAQAVAASATQLITADCKVLK